MDRPTFQRWLDDYVAAWKSYDPAAIGALFSENAEYRYHPQDQAVVGREAIVASWLEGRDEPGTYDAKYEPLAIDGDVHVAHGTTSYFDANRQLRDQYCNIYVCRFDADGRCSGFTEYWIQSRRFSRSGSAQAEA
jgi:hypothetical protein